MTVITIFIVITFRLFLLSTNYNLNNPKIEQIVPYPASHYKNRTLCAGQRVPIISVI